MKANGGWKKCLFYFLSAVKLRMNQISKMKVRPKSPQLISFDRAYSARSDITSCTKKTIQQQNINAVALTPHCTQHYRCHDPVLSEMYAMHPASMHSIPGYENHQFGQGDAATASMWPSLQCLTQRQDCAHTMK